MKPSQLATWMEQEGKKVHDLGNRLGEHIATIPTGDLTKWLVQFAERFDHVAAHMRRMMNIEEEGGYLVPVLEQRPTLIERVAALKHQHSELRRLMDDLERTVHNLHTDDTIIIHDTCMRVQAFLGHIAQHDEHENHIVLYSFTQDIGGGH